MANRPTMKYFRPTILSVIRTIFSCLKLINKGRGEVAIRMPRINLSVKVNSHGEGFSNKTLQLRITYGDAVYQNKFQDADVSILLK